MVEYYVIKNDDKTIELCKNMRENSLCQTYPNQEDNFENAVRRAKEISMEKCKDMVVISLERKVLVSCQVKTL